jgi:hypothetical protein
MIDAILLEIEEEPFEPGLDLIEQTERALESINQEIPDAKQFVAGSFQAFIPA